MSSNLRKIEDFLRWDPKQKRYFPNFYRKEILPKWLGFSNEDLQAPLGVATVAAAGAMTAPVGYKQPYASVEGLDAGLGTPFEVRSITFADSTDGTAAAAFTVVMTELGETRRFMNNPIHIRAFAGVAQTPALLREPYMFLSQHNISVQFAKLTGGATTVRMFLNGAEYFPWSPELMRRKQAAMQLQGIIHKWMERRKYVTPFWLTTEETVSLTANATAEAFMKIGDDGHFEAFTFSAISDGNFSWEISEAKTQKTLMNGLATQTNSLGDADFPTLLPRPYLIPAGLRIRLRVTDLSAANNNIFFSMSGRKIYAPLRQVAEVLADTEIYKPTVLTPAGVQPQIVPAPMM